MLPICYGYTVGAFLKNDDTYSIQLPHSWDDLVNNKDYNLEENHIPQFIGSFYNVFGNYVNYKSHELLYTEAEMLARIQEAISLGTENYSSINYEDGNLICPIGVILSTARKNENYIFNAIPSVEGGITANIIMYAAINRSTPWPKEAFSILDVLFSDEVMTGRGFDVGEKTYGNRVDFVGNSYGIVAHKDGWYSSFTLSDESLEAFNDLNSRISSVRYYSNLDADLLEMYNNCLYARNEEEQKKIVSQIYNRMKMKLAE